MQRQWLSVSRRGSYLHGLTCPATSDADVGIVLARNLRHLASTRRRSDVHILNVREYAIASSRCTAPPEIPAALTALSAGGLLDVFPRAVEAPPPQQQPNECKIDLDVSFIDDALTAVFDSGPTVHVAWLNAVTNPLTVVNPLVCTPTLWKVLARDLVPRIMYRSEALQYLMRGARGIAAHSKDDAGTVEAALAARMGVALGVGVAERQLKQMKAFSFVVLQALQAVHLLRAYHETIRADDDAPGQFSFEALAEQHRWDTVAHRVCKWQYHTTPNQAETLMRLLSEVADLRRSKDVVRWLTTFPAERRRETMGVLVAVFDAHLVDGAWEGQSSVAACREAVDVWLYELANSF